MFIKELVEWGQVVKSGKIGRRRKFEIIFRVGLVEGRKMGTCGEIED